MNHVLRVFNIFADFADAHGIILVGAGAEVFDKRLGGQSLLFVILNEGDPILRRRTAPSVFFLQVRE